MNPEYEKRLEAEIDRELNGLPELDAPGTLAPRVLSAIARRATAPWYRQSWQMWPVALRAASLALSLALVGTLCFGLWMLPQTEGFAAALHQVASRFSWVGVGWNVLSALLGAVVLAVKQLGSVFLIACFLLIAVGWAMFVGLGTVYVRLAFARR